MSLGILLSVRWMRYGLIVNSLLLQIKLFLKKKETKENKAKSKKFPTQNIDKKFAANKLIR